MHETRSDPKNLARFKRLMSALDTVNERWGTGTLQYASSGIGKAWKAKFHRHSPAYTTDWDALPIAMA